MKAIYWRKGVVIDMEGEIYRVLKIEVYNTLYYDTL